MPAAQDKNSVKVQNYLKKGARVTKGMLGGCDSPTQRFLLAGQRAFEEGRPGKRKQRLAARAAAAAAAAVTSPTSKDKNKKRMAKRGRRGYG